MVCCSKFLHPETSLNFVLSRLSRGFVDYLKEHTYLHVTQLIALIGPHPDIVHANCHHPDPRVFRQDFCAVNGPVLITLQSLCNNL